MTTEQTADHLDLATATLEQFGTPIAPFGSVLSQDTAIRQANDALTDATNSAASIVAVQDDFKIEDLEQYSPLRRRAKGVMSTQAIQSFAMYTQKHIGAGTTVFVDADHLRATAVLDFGDTTAPGHCDNLCSLVLKTTAAYDALIGACGRKLSQRDFAEWLENWQPYITAQSEGVALPFHQALAAVRNITVESAQSAQHREEALSASRSTFESVKAKSDDAIPTLLNFPCRPAPELSPREYMVRVSVLTGESKPQFQLSIIALEEHRERAAAEMCGLIREVIPAEVPVLMGSYRKN